MSLTLSVYNEFTQLHDVIVCKPLFYQQVPPINKVEDYYFHKNPPRLSKLIEQHEAWTELLESLDVTVHYLPPTDGLPHQMFTRDIGFVIGEQMIVANMARAIRDAEVDVLEAWLKEEGIKFKTLAEGYIEGGDVLVHAPYVFVGHSRRTSRAAGDALQKVLGSEWTVVPIKLAPGVLHLDCVMAIVNHQTMIWSPELIVSGHEVLRDLFRTRVKVDKHEVFHMATNILRVNMENVLIEKRHKRLARELRKIGVRVHPVDWSEIKKLGGLFRCATLALG